MKKQYQSVRLRFLLTAIAMFYALQPSFCDTSKRPNFLFILVDDQAPFHLKCYDPKSGLDTPHLDKLAAGGLVLDGAYHMGSFHGAVCIPSRYMIMSGRTLWHLPIGPQAEPQCPPHLEKQTIPAVFNRAGYDTMRTCKTSATYQEADREFTVRREATKRGGDAETGSAWHADQVLDFLQTRTATKATNPFFIYLGFSHPHDVRDGTPELLAKYGAVNHADPNVPLPLNPKAPPLPRNWLPSHPFPHGHPNLRDEVAVSGVWENRDPATIRNETGREFACIENIDTQIGRVLEKLEAMGELENTYIIFTADNGIGIGRHGLIGKQNLYEHSWRVPFIVKGPVVKPGARAQGNIYLLDTLKTLCDLAGIDTPPTNEGLSFRSVLTGENNAIRETLYGVYSGGTKPGIRAVRQGDWKLIQYDTMDGTVRETQLFNLAENPDELLAEHHDPAIVAQTGYQPTANQRNLADEPAYAEKLDQMKSLLLSEMRRNDDPWRLWDQPADPPVPLATPRAVTK